MRLLDWNNDDYETEDILLGLRERTVDMILISIVLGVYVSWECGHYFRSS